MMLMTGYNPSFKFNPYTQQVLEQVPAGVMQEPMENDFCPAYHNGSFVKVNDKKPVSVSDVIQKMLLEKVKIEARANIMLEESDSIRDETKKFFFKKMEEEARINTILLKGVTVRNFFEKQNANLEDMTRNMETLYDSLKGFRELISEAIKELEPIYNTTKQ